MVLTKKKPETGKVFERTFTAVVRALEGNGDTVEFSFSSETPYERWWGTEILSHDEVAISLERVGGMNWLWNHNQNIVLGKIEDIFVEDKKGRCRARWSKKASVAEYRQDFEDGILTNVSVSYSIDEYYEQKTEDGEAYFCTRWTPYEISLVSVPADASVGVGRSTSEFNMEQSPSGLTMGNTISDAKDLESKRVKEIFSLGQRFGMSELANSLIDNDTTVEVAYKTILDKITPAQTPVAKAIDTTLGLSDREQKSYSIIRAINAVAFGNRSEASFEMECSREIAKRLGRSSNGFFMPVRDLRASPLESRATYAVGAGATGGYTVETALLEENFIDLLRNRSTILQMGAMMLSGLVGNVDIPFQATTAQTYWVGEGENITRSEGTFGQIPLRMKTVGALSRYTRNMMLQSSIDIERFIRNDFAAIIALAIDAAAIGGSGSSNQPRGILNTSGVGSVALGVNGAVPTWPAVVNLVREISLDNAQTGTMQWLTNPQVWAKLMTVPKQGSGVEGNFILTDPGSSLLGYAFNATNQVPANLTKGSGTNLSALVLGVWDQLIIGEWGIFEVLANPFSDAVFASGGVEVRAMQSIDIAVRHPESFAVITDMVTT